MPDSTPWIGALSTAILYASLVVSAQAAPSGRQVVAQHGCAACHGDKGEGRAAAGYPRLAGQSSGYLLAQLQAFANGERPKDVVMDAQASPLSADEMRAIAQYYASLVVPASHSARTAGQAQEIGREIVANGLWRKNIPACRTCHGPGARGLLNFPSLAGQSADYIEKQLMNWRAGNRPPGPDGLMARIAMQLDTGQIHAVAGYLASLPPTGPIPAEPRPDIAPATADAMPGFFQPPLLSDVPKGKFGEAVKRGYRIFTETPKYAADYVGNGLSCSNCHLHAGRRANSAPMWGAWGMYPAYRGKNKRVNNMIMRLQGCFRYSENAPASSSGRFPPADAQVMIDLESYIYWLSRGVPTGKKMAGRAYPRLADPPRPFSRKRGAVVYAANCALCHGADGQGHKLADGSYAFPPLWGAQAYNWGAGMHAVDKAAAFIHGNMPLGNAGKLNLQQTWDVAAWIDSHPRPQDPRFNGNLKQTIRLFHHKRKMDYYGKTVDGQVLGAGVH